MVAHRAISTLLLKPQKKKGKKKMEKGKVLWRNIPSIFYRFDTNYNLLPINDKAQGRF